MESVLERVGCEGQIRGGDTRASTVLTLANRIKASKDEVEVEVEQA